MAHIHELIDFVIDIYIIYKGKTLLIYHKELNKWLPIGGHIELDEDPEECGLEIEILGEKPKIQSKGTKFLYPPAFLDIHDISDTHKHIGLYYFARAKSDNVVLNKEEHTEIRWFNLEDLDNPEFNLSPAVKFYAKYALNRF